MDMVIPDENAATGAGAMDKNPVITVAADKARVSCCLQQGSKVPGADDVVDDGEAAIDTANFDAFIHVFGNDVTGTNGDSASTVDIVDFDAVIFVAEDHAQARGAKHLTAT